MKRSFFLIFALSFAGCATVDSVKTWINKKTVTEQAVITAQEDVNAAQEAGAEIYATQEFSEARSFLMMARQMLEDKNFDKAQEMAARASSSAKKAKNKAVENKKKKSGTKKGGK